MKDTENKAYLDDEALYELLDTLPFAEGDPFPCFLDELKELRQELKKKTKMELDVPRQILLTLRALYFLAAQRGAENYRRSILSYQDDASEVDDLPFQLSAGCEEDAEEELAEMEDEYINHILFDLFGVVFMESELEDPSALS